MPVLANLDLLTVGIVVAATCVLGFAVYFSDPKSITNKTFLFFSLITAIWGIVNYLEFQFTEPLLKLWMTRLIVFLAVFHAMLIYTLFLVFPNERFSFSKYYKFIILPLTLFTSILTLTPAVFVEVSNLHGEVTSLTTNWGIMLFVILAIYFVINALNFLFKKLHNAKSTTEKKSLILISIGFILSFSLILILAMIVPVFFSDTRFNKYSSLLIFPFIAFSAYAILKHKLLQIKSGKSLIIIFILLTIVFLGFVYLRNNTEVMLAGVIYLIIIIFSIFLIKILIHEAQQKIEIQNLAQELKIANDRLKEIEELKSEFISLATHHISSPLTSINNSISILKEENYNTLSQGGRELLDSSEQSTANLIQVIQDFLTVYRLDDDKTKYKFTEVDLNQIIKKALDSISFRIDEKKIFATYSFDSHEKYTVNGDMYKLEQAFISILKNSVKNVPKNGEINITVTRKNNRYEINISDNGIRNLPNISDRLRRKFTDSGNEFEANMLGNSLGLYSAKQTFIAHSGNLSIKKKDNSSGAEFVIIL